MASDPTSALDLRTRGDHGPAATGSGPMPPRPPARSWPDAVLTIGLDDYDTPTDVIDALALGAFVSGTEPWARGQRLPRVRPEATLLPEGAAVARSATDGSRTAHLAVGEGWTLRAVRWRDGTADVMVTAVDEAVGQAILTAATADAVLPDEPEDDTVNLGFWHHAAHGPRRHERTISATPWADLRRNYNRRAGAALDALMSRTADDIDGRLLLLHGPPGTGKTTALRSLAHAWRPWCRFDDIIDPERLFQDPGYLMTAALGDDDAGDGEGPGRRWRMLILEDCDELIRSDAKQGTGQSLARLLNITDGLLGQGLDLVVALTTNEPMGRLHPAVTRPGRCLAQIEIGPFSPAEARTWLGRPARVGPEGATLAELYQLDGDLHVVGDDTRATGTGQYL